jgi:hypothetical protein
MSKLKNFKSKSRKAAKKRLSLTGAKNFHDKKITAKKSYASHRQINKPRSRKLAAIKGFTLSDTTKKYKFFI